MDPDNFVRGWGLFFAFFFSHQGISQRAVRTFLEKKLDPLGPIASRGGGGGFRRVSVTKPIATCDFPVGGGPPAPSFGSALAPEPSLLSAVIMARL